MLYGKLQTFGYVVFFMCLILVIIPSCNFRRKDYISSRCRKFSLMTTIGDLTFVIICILSNIKVY